MSDTPRPSVSDVENERAYLMAAVYSDRFHVNVDTAGVRITFSEILPMGRPPAPRAALFVSHENAVALADLLKSLMAEHLSKSPSTGGG
jgi:hypothetical protein